MTNRTIEIIINVVAPFIVYKNIMKIFLSLNERGLRLGCIKGYQNIRIPEDQMSIYL